MPCMRHIAGFLFVLVAAAVGIAAMTLPSPVNDISAGTPPVRPASSPADTLDTRPLRLLMVELGQDMNRISDGLWHEDFDMIRRAGRSIADHPKITPEQMQAIRRALGDRFEQFVAYDRVVHDAASRLADAASDRDLSSVLEHRIQLTNGCIGCHATFRDDVRSELH